jgi:hypothetical protein
MKDENIIRLLKYDTRKSLPLGYYVWTPDATFPRPDELTEFNSTKSYSVDDVIVANETTLLHCIRKPVEGPTRPQLNVPPMTQSNFDVAANTFVLNGETYILVSGAPESRRLAKWTGTSRSGQGALRLYKWLEDIAQFQFITTIPTSWENIEVTVIDDKAYFVGGRAPENGTTFNTANVYTYDGTVLAVGRTYPAGQHIKEIPIGRRKYYVTYGENEQSRIFYLDSRANSLIFVDDFELETGWYITGIKELIVGGNVYIYVAQYNDALGEGKLDLWRWDQLKLNFTVVENIRTTGYVTAMDTYYYNLTYHLAIASDTDFLQLFTFDVETATTSHLSDINDYIDYQGTDYNIRYPVLSLKVLIDEEQAFLIAPILKGDDGLQTVSVVCTWDSTASTFIPFKGVETTGAANWHVFETPTGIYSVMNEAINDNGTTGYSRILGWDIITRTFSATLVELSGGSVWNIDDWEELRTSVSFVQEHHSFFTYGHDDYIYSGGQIMFCNKAKITGIYNPEDWSPIKEKQYIKTAAYYDTYALFADHRWTEGMVVQVKPL